MALVSLKTKHTDALALPRLTGQVWPCHSPISHPQSHHPKGTGIPAALSHWRCQTPKPTGFGSSLKHLEEVLGCSHSGSSALQCLFDHHKLSLVHVLFVLFASEIFQPLWSLLSAPSLFQPSPITLGQALLPYLSGSYLIPTEAHRKTWHQRGPLC